MHLRVIVESLKTRSAPMAKTVLIVDDNAFIRQALCELFTRETDFEICGEAENGKVAIEKAQELHPDLIVMDRSMPDEWYRRRPCTEKVDAYRAAHYL
jgi:DNA-binding NarL/FixJ family response regulator